MQNSSTWVCTGQTRIGNQLEDSYQGQFHPGSNGKISTLAA